jgi:hypothetical protein
MSNKSLEFLFYMKSQQNMYNNVNQITIDNHFSENCVTQGYQHQFSNIIRKNKNYSNNNINNIQYQQCLKCSVIEFN